jgi:hypothetical protein
LPATRFPGQATDGLLANQLSHCIAIGRWGSNNSGRRRVKR